MSGTGQQSFQDIISDPELKEHLKKIVLERVNVMPDTLGIAIGSEHLTKGDLVSHVLGEDEIGKQFMELELEYLQGLASGAIYGNE